MCVCQYVTELRFETLNHLLTAKIANFDVIVLRAIAALTAYMCDSLQSVGNQYCDHANCCSPAGAIGTRSVRSSEVFKDLVLPVVRK
jgi:hypothetical protein